METLGPRSFTTLANLLNLLGVSLIGLPVPSYDSSMWMGLLLHALGLDLGRRRLSLGLAKP